MAQMAEPSPPLTCGSRAEWEAWLDAHHTEASGVWLKIAKKGAHTLTVSYAEALESALCYGWIDGQKAALDEAFWLQRFTPRRAGSGWSKVNREKAEALTASGKMRPAGLRQVEQAKADGRWEAAYDSQRTAAPPADFLAMLEQRPEARAFFESLNSANRYAIVYRLQTAKKPETRAARMQRLIEMLERGEKIHP